MASTGANSNREEQVAFHDLESFLQKSSNCKELEVIECTATKLLPLGENFCSVLVKIEATIRRKKDAQVERVHLAAKTQNKVSRPIVDWATTFDKEVFAYETLLPSYRNLEKEAGIEASELIDVWPKYIGHRYSLGKGNDMDEHSALLMENIKAKGYYNCDRRIGLGVRYAKKALSALARFHALGMTMKHRRTEFFKRCLTHARKVGVDFAQLSEGYDASLRDFIENPSLAGNRLPIIEKSYERIKNDRALTVSLDEPWSTITHGDFWVNNMLFHRNERGDIDDIKFVDFQMYLFHSPLKDMPYFLMTSLDDDTLANCIDELLDVYYETFTNTLQRMGVDNKTFTRQSFDAELKRQAINEFPLAALANKFFVYEVDAEAKSDELIATVFESRCTDACRRRLARLVHTYEQRGWF